MKQAQIKTITRVLAVTVVCVVGLAMQAGSAMGAAEPAWRLLAGVGPTHLPPEQSETQRVTVEAEGGTFTLTPNTGTGTGTLDFASGFGNYGVGVTEIQVLQFFPTGTFAVGQTISGPGIPSGTTITAVNGTTLTLSAATTSEGSFASVTAGSKVVSNVVVTTGGFNIGDAIVGTGIPSGTTIAAVGSGTLTLSAVPISGGSTALTARETTLPIPAGAPGSGAGSVEAALNALPAFGPGTVSVVRQEMEERELGFQYFVTFGGPFVNQNVSQLSADGTALVGPNKNIEVNTTVNGGPGTGKVIAYPINVGGKDTSGTIAVTFGPLPAGVVTDGTGTGEDWSCLGGAGEVTATCTTTDLKPAGLVLSPVAVPVRVESPAAPGGNFEVSVSGGGAAESRSYQTPLVISAQPAKPGTEAFLAGAFDEVGAAEVRAGGHPETALSGFLRNTVRSGSGEIVPAGDPREINVDLPPGFIGNPLVTPRCPQSDLTCANSAAYIGRLQVSTAKFGEPVETGAGIAGVANDVPPKGYAAEFSAQFGIPTANLLGSLRSDEDYGVTVTSPRTSTYYKIFAVFASLKGRPVGGGGKAFFSNPTACVGGTANGLVVGLTADTWQVPDLFTSVSEAQLPVKDCNKLEFGTKDRPVGFTFQPGSGSAATGTAATAELTIDQSDLTDWNKLATPHLKKSVVTLPEGLVLNPSALNGLEACSTQQMGLKGTGFPAPNPVRFNLDPVSCPNGSKIGTAEVVTPLLEEPLAGTVFLAAQGDNPFKSLLAMYIVVEDEQTGVVLKLPGKVTPNPVTGQLTAEFDNNPQTPFSSLTLNFRGGGPRSTLATPDVCGEYTTSGTFTPWSAPESGPPATTEDDFAITTGVGGSASCPASKAARPFALGFEAGTTNPVAGAHSPFTLRITRPDGNQELSTVSVATPPGFAATLKGVAVCSDAQLAQAIGRNQPGDGKAELDNPSCPASSQVGTTTIGVGVGSEPFFVKTGKVYRTGAYKGAKQSLTFVVPAVAGPFDLGVQVVRTALQVNPVTAQITAVSDPIPQMLQGLPLQVREIRVDVDRPGFTINPTSCEPMSVNGQIGGGSGAVANVTNRFQVGGCENLKFKPKLQLTYKGATKRTGNPGLRAVLTQPAGQANISRTVVLLPLGSLIDNEHINNPCTRAQYAANACPSSSILGTATAYSPLLDQPLKGNVYFRSNGGERELPDVVASLKGEVDVELVGFVDAVQNKKAGTSRVRNTFAVVPDAPVSKFELNLKGGKLGLIENGKNLCKQVNRSTVKMSAHNGRALTANPAVKTSCPRKKKSKKKQ